MKIVTVYEDVITRQKVEGLAEVLSKIGEPDRDFGQRCEVHFLGDDPSEVVERWVPLEEFTEKAKK